MIVFLCKFSSGDLQLSKEHQAYDWVDIEKDADKIPFWLGSARDNFMKYNQGRI